MLIGYESGQIVLWDLRLKSPDYRCQTTEPLKSISWHHDGKQFMCSHTDGSLSTWALRQLKPINVTHPHGEFIVSLSHLWFIKNFNTLTFNVTSMQLRTQRMESPKLANPFKKSNGRYRDLGKANIHTNILILWISEHIPRGRPVIVWQAEYWSSPRNIYFSFNRQLITR